MEETYITRRNKITSFETEAYSTPGNDNGILYLFFYFQEITYRIYCYVSFLKYFFFILQIIVQQAQQRYYEMLEMKTKFEYLESKELYKIMFCM